MKLPLFIAQRYLLAKKSHNLINIITWISIVSVGVAAFAMIFVLSVFNGFNVVISDSIHKLSPDLRVTATEGKTVNLKDFPFDKIKNVKNVDFVLPTITEDALFRNADKQQIGQIKGLPDEYEDIDRINGSVVGGKGLRLHREEYDFATPGSGMAYYLGINPNRPYSMVQVYVPRRGNASSFNIENSFNNGQLFVNQVFSTQQEIDDQLILAPYQWLSDLIGYDSLSSAVEIFVPNGKDAARSLSAVKKEIQNILGPGFKVDDQYEQQSTLYKMMKSEKLAVYLILTFILIMATFNVIGSLSMLIIEKKKDTSTLRAMGADNTLIHNIFLNEGTLIAVVGGIIGLVLGIIAVLLQQYVGIIRLGDGTGNYIVDYYPVALKLTDILVVLATIVVIGGIAAWTTVKVAMKKM
ncbi:MAG: FtsX-like permease family protein [Bacteroidales bacterium]|nr:FtsX-like permease family protein [Bacteroidales bacterium]